MSSPFLFFCLFVCLFSEECAVLWSDPTVVSGHGTLCWRGCVLTRHDRLHLHGQGEQWEEGGREGRARRGEGEVREGERGN